MCIVIARSSSKTCASLFRLLVCHACKLHITWRYANDVTQKRTDVTIVNNLLHCTGLQTMLL